VGAGASAMAALGLVVRARSKPQVPERQGSAAADQVPPPAPAQVVEAPPTGGAPREFLAAWVQFLKDDITEATNALHNRLNVISARATMVGRNLSDEHREELEQIKLEVALAAKITASLQRRVTAMAPDTAPPVLYEYDGSAMDPTTILLVENDDANRSVITKLFERLGHRVIPVTNGLDAFDQLQSRDIECVVCDLRLPYVGGRTLFEQVEERLPHLAGRFVFVTGDYTNPESRAFLEQSGQPVVAKPYELDALLGAVASILRGRRALTVESGSVSGSA